jgi:hypothetical protein
MVVVNIYGAKLIIKKNPWYHGTGKLKAIVREGLATPSKSFYLATPPPWFEDPTKLSEGQLAVVRDFVKINWEMRGKPLAERIRTIKDKMKGKAYVPEEKRKKKAPSIKYKRLPKEVVAELERAKA